MGMGVRGQGACAHQLIKIISKVRSHVAIPTLPMITWDISSLRMLSNNFFIEALDLERSLMWDERHQHCAAI